LKVLGLLTMVIGSRTAAAWEAGLCADGFSVSLGQCAYLPIWIPLLKAFPDVPFMRPEWSGTVAALVLAGIGFVFVALEISEVIARDRAGHVPAMMVFLIGVYQALAVLQGRPS
jgi:hypothetical protein